MTVVSRSWNRLTLPGKIVFTIVPVLLALTIGLLAVVILLGGPIVNLLADNILIVRFVVAITIILLITIPTAFLIIYMELKVIALMNLRIGPDRVGPFGSVQSVVPGLKVLMKEDFTPTGADPIVFTWAPVVTYLASVLTLLVIPFAPGLVGQDLNIGLLYFFAIGGLSVVGLLMAGWSSYNKYSLLGGLRSAAQVVSYEIPLTLSVVGLILLAGTMSLNQIVENQAGWFTDWYVFQQPLGVLIFFIAATAEAEPDAVRPDRGRLGDRRRLRHRVLGDALRVLLLRRVRERVHHLGADRDPLLRWLERAVPVAVAARRQLRSGQPRDRDAPRDRDHPGHPDPGLRGAGLAGKRPDQGLAGAHRRFHPGQPVHRRASSARGPTSGSTGSPGCCGSWPRRTASCSCSSGCAGHCPASGSTS